MTGASRDGSLAARLTDALDLEPPGGREHLPAAEVVVGRLLRGALVLAAVLIAGQIALHLTNILVFERGVNSFDADEDGGVFAWVSTVVTFAAGLAALLLALVTARKIYGALALLFVFFSFDDTFRLHERAGEIDTALGFSREAGIGRVLWPILFFPLLAGAVLLLLLIARDAPRRIAHFLVAGIGLLGAAIVAEAASPILFEIGWEYRSWPYEIEVLIEESAELLGWIAIAAGLGALACRALIRLGDQG